jgi:hypothetical protein
MSPSKIGRQNASRSHLRWVAKARTLALRPLDLLGPAIDADGAFQIAGLHVDDLDIGVEGLGRCFVDRIRSVIAKEFAAKLLD